MRKKIEWEMAGKKGRIRSAAGWMAGTLLIGMLCLSGCGDYPDLTESQVERAGEYAAMTLLKYDSQKRSRLMTLEDMQAEEQRRLAWKKAASQVRKEEESSEEESSESGQESQTEKQSGQEKGSYGKLEDGFVLPDGMTISYTGYSLCDVYPEDDSGFFAVPAAPGKENLVLYFSVANGSDGAQKLDLAGLSNLYRATVNDSYTRTNLATLLDMDLDTYQGLIGPGEEAEMVLLFEVDEGTRVDSLKLRIKNERIESTILLEP